MTNRDTPNNKPVKLITCYKSVTFLTRNWGGGDIYGPEYMNYVMKNRPLHIASHNVAKQPCLKAFLFAV